MTLPRPLNGSMNCIGGCGGTPEVRDAGDAHILNLHLMSGVDTLTGFCGTRIRFTGAGYTQYLTVGVPGTQILQ